MQGIGAQRGQGRRGALFGINLAAIGRKDLDGAGDGANLRTAADARRYEHAAHQQGGSSQGSDAEEVHRLFKRAAGMAVAKLRCLTLERRTQPHGIAIPQLNPANAAVAVKQPIRGVEIFERELAIARPLLLEDGVHPAQAGFGQGQVAGRIAAQPVALGFERQLGEFLAAGPELHAGLMGAQRLPGLGDGRWPLSPGPLQRRLGQRKPGQAHLRRGQARLQGFELRRGNQAGVAARP